MATNSSSSSSSSYTEGFCNVYSEDDPSLADSELAIKFTTIQVIQSSKIHQQTRELIGEHSSRFPAKSIISDKDHQAAATFLGFISENLSDRKIPFPLEKIRWRRLEKQDDQIIVLNRQELLKLIINKARETVKRFSNHGLSTKIVASVYITRKVSLSDHEYEAMENEKCQQNITKSLVEKLSIGVYLKIVQNKPKLPWYVILEETKGVILDQETNIRAPSNISMLEDKYKNKLSRELLNQAMKGLFMHRGDEIIQIQPKKESQKICSICLVQVNIRQRQKEKIRTKLEEEEDDGIMACWLPCSHVFHRDCIGPWLTKNPSCHVCHFSIKSGQAFFFS